MCLYRTGIWFLFIILWIAGCTHYPSGRTIAPPAETSVPQKEYQRELEEKARMVELQKTMIQWEEELNALINSFQAETGKNKSMAGRGFLPEGEEYHKQQEDVLQVLKRMKILQLKLHETDTALSREVIYMNLINLYLSGLKSLEETRERKPSAGMDATKIKEAVEDNYQGKNFTTVVDLYHQLPDQGSDLKSPAYYALSLAQLARTEEAITFVEHELERGILIVCENAPLWFEIGEWLINNGQIDVAQRLFQKVALYYQTEEVWYDKTRKKAALFGGGSEHLIVKNKIDQAVSLFEEKRNFSEAYTLFLEAQKDCPDFACQEEVQTVIVEFIDRAVADMEEKVRRIDEKIEHSQFFEARKVLYSLKESFPGEGYPLPIAERLALIPEKEKYLQEKEAGWKDDVAQQHLERANSLLEGENYEEAVVIFDQLQGTAYHLEAERGRQVAIDGLARMKRLKAGQLFLQAKSCEDPELKKNYLIESYSLLKEVNDHYPTNSYAEKIRKNLEDVRIEIEKVYPEFFSGEELSRDMPAEFSEGEPR